MRALVTGATGFVGTQLLQHLEGAVVLSRSGERAKRDLGHHQVTAYSWDPLAGPPPQEAFDRVETVFHLAGEPVAGGRWTAERKRLIRESRVQGTHNLVEALQQRAERPRVLVSASAIGYYGDRSDTELNESASPGNDFLAEVCQAWEQEAQRASELGVRVVCVRIGIVLGRGGGALQKMLTPFKLGLGGPLGSGQQWMSWIHVDDLARLMMFLATRADIAGPVNGVAPNPVRNRDFTKALASALHRPAFMRTPYFAMRLLMGEFASVLYASQRVDPEIALARGFGFHYPQIGHALTAAVGQRQGEAARMH